jgi:hypothetical protein
MGFIKSSAEINTLAESEQTSGGVYFITAFSGLLAPYWDTSAGGMLIGGLSFHALPSPYNTSGLRVLYMCSLTATLPILFPLSYLWRE